MDNGSERKWTKVMDNSSEVVTQELAPVPLDVVCVPQRQAPGGEIVTPARPRSKSFSCLEALLGKRFPRLRPVKPDALEFLSIGSA